jgi:CRP-like cAMP-binding protein
MKLTLGMILLNFYYIGVTIALLIKDILWLRVVLIIAGTSLISYGISTKNFIVVSWNCLFLSINIIQVIKLILERKPVKIDENIMHIYTAVFSDIRKKDFLYLWKSGKINEKENILLCEHGKKQDSLLLIIDGNAMVKKNNRKVTTLKSGQFIAEIAFITGKEATADVIAKGRIKYISWTYTQIEQIKQINPHLSSKLQFIISKDLTTKLSQRQY